MNTTNKARWLRLKRHFTESFTGELLPRKRAQDSGHVDEARDKRRRNAYRYIFLLLAVTLLPIVANNFYIGQKLPAVAGLLLLSMLMVDILLISIHREALLSPPIAVGICIGLVILSLYHGQMHSLFLLFPLLVALPVMFKTQWAIVLAVLSAGAAAPVVLTQFDLTTAIAVGISLVLTWLVSTWLVYAMTQQSRRLKGMAITDSLTGAFNRRYLELQASRALQDWERHRRSVSLVLLDIDHFKKINDKYGHNVGDTALKSLVGLLKERIRGVDTLSRYGGEEFVLLLSETTAVQAKIVANQLRRAVEQAQLLPHGAMTVSVGICDVRQVKDIESWLKFADAALYTAKDLGRNRVELAEPSSIAVSDKAPILKKVAVGRQ